jgi:hypothetical protein
MGLSTLRVQGWYYVLTCIWPLVSMKTFELVTGKKKDKWLVRTVGVLVLLMGLCFLEAERRGRVTPELKRLAALSALGLAAIDTIYSVPGTISRIYLLDALIEMMLAKGMRSMPKQKAA